MATNRPISPLRLRRDSTESYASLWEKVYEGPTATKQDAPFAINGDNDDSLEQNPTPEDYEEYDTDADQSLSPSASLPSSTSFNSLKPWEQPTSQNHLTIIINHDPNSDDRRSSLKKDLSKKGLNWTNDEEKLRPWHFGLTALHLELTNAQTFDIQILILSSKIPFWLKLKTEKQKPIPKDDAQKKSIPHKVASGIYVALRYGAFTDLNEFRYSQEHSWEETGEQSSKETARWSLLLDDHRSGGQIEWVIQNPQIRRKKQLLIANINPCVVVDLYPEGFDIYICQKCNINEFEAKVRSTDNRTHRSEQSGPRQSRGTSSDYQQRKPNSRPLSKPRRPPPLCPKNNQHSPRQRSVYEFYQRVGFHPPGCYFSTVQFTLRVNQSSLTNTTRSAQKEIRRMLSLLIEFFLSHRVTVCYGKINADSGPKSYPFFQQKIPNFPSLIMKYSWQILSTNGYCLQLKVDSKFLETLFEIQVKEENPDELFYRVCVYLSRICSVKPFLDLNHELQHAITESKRKRDQSAFGLVRKLEFDGDNEVYVPSVTLTPTTIRIKPLKLCRTNRVLRATQTFGCAVEHFALVDIRDENGRVLQSYHFRDLRSVLLKYLKNGFTLMNDNRQYEYLHHSQSQLRARQFWFYHAEPDDSNVSFDKAYSWMGTFDQEKNPAKYAARMALCFSTTKTTGQVSTKDVLFKQPDIKTADGRLTFTDGCGTMSIALRDQIKNSLGARNDFSAVQFRYNGAKGVVSVYPDMPRNIHLRIRDSMKKFDSKHDDFEVCKLSAPRPQYLNRQAILLLSYRQVPDVSFLVLQQRNHLALIRALLRNTDAQKLILQKIPAWLLPKDIHFANIDYIHEPFFRQLLISSCLQSTRELLYRTRIQIPPNEGRNMFGVIDEYNVLKADEVFIQFTVLNRDASPNDNNKKKTKTLNKCKVVITKNPCHHPGDIRTFTAINHPRLKHLIDVVVFSQQGDRPAPHDISGSDLDGDEYLVVWHEDLVPHTTPNAQPYDYDAHISSKTYDQPVERDDINQIVLDIAEQDCLGRLSNLHLAFVDKFGVDSARRLTMDVLSTVELAGAISREVDSGKTGEHPLNDDEIKKLNNALGGRRPDYMDNPNFEQEVSQHILGQLYRASKRTLPGWNQLVRYHRHLRHLQVRTHDEPEDEEEGVNDDEKLVVHLDESLLIGVNRLHPAYGESLAIADRLAFVYRQEILEILTLYGLSHESDLWCRNSSSGFSGELEDTAYTELEQLVVRTRNCFFYDHVGTCESGQCEEETAVSALCNICRKRRQSIAVACYCACYNKDSILEEAPILSLPWLFAGSLLENRKKEKPIASLGSLSTAMEKVLAELIIDKRRLTLDGLTLGFRISNESSVGRAAVDVSVCAFIEVLQVWFGKKRHRQWLSVLSRFVLRTPSFVLEPNQTEITEEWKLILRSHKIHRDDDYSKLLMSIEWTEEEDTLMHDHFENILEICFEEGRRTNDTDFLHISEDILLLLQQMAINETVF